jgi:uncharacterized damage-inducible protein DinB
MRKVLLALLICAGCPPPFFAADNPFSTFNKTTYAKVKDIQLSSAEKMPAEKFGFRPTRAVRSYGQIIGHLADAQYLMCSIALGEKNPNEPGNRIEQTKTAKSDLIGALREALRYCDKAYDGITDKSGAQIINLFGEDMPRQDVLAVNIMHDMEHYGNLVTYLRMKGLVPRTSEPEVGKLFPWE